MATSANEALKELGRRAIREALRRHRHVSVRTAWAYTQLPPPPPRWFIVLFHRELEANGYREKIRTRDRVYYIV